MKSIAQKYAAQANNNIKWNLSKLWPFSKEMSSPEDGILQSPPTAELQ